MIGIGDRVCSQVHWVGEWRWIHGYVIDIDGDDLLVAWGDGLRLWTPRDELFVVIDVSCDA